MTELSEALAVYKARHGHVARKDLIERICGAGVTTQSDIPADKVAAVLDACNKADGGSGGRKAKAHSPKPAFDDPNWVQGVVYARWNRA